MCARSSELQSISFPGRVGPVSAFLRTIFLPRLMRASAWRMASWAICSPAVAFWLSQWLNESLATPGDEHGSLA